MSVDVRLTFAALLLEADVKVSWVGLEKAVGNADVKVTWACVDVVPVAAQAKFTWLGLYADAVSLYPVVSDVRFGLAYGPTGTEYIGTMVSSSGSYVRRR